MNTTPKLEAPGVIMIDTKHSHNIGGAIRACSCFGVKSLVWTGVRIELDRFARLPREERMKGYKDVTWTRSDRPFDLFPKDIVPVCVEIHPGATCLTQFEHPEKAVYVFGPEDGSVPQVTRRFCHCFVFIPSHFCLNVSAAVNVVLAHRRISRQLAGKEEMLPMEQMLHEVRGEAVLTPTMDANGWDGR
jgi:tRNA(Leu) C34 or U34 (ribose-2'-O)-methylase TrmL